MPTDLVLTTSELSSCAHQLAVAAGPTAQGRRSGKFSGPLRIEIAVVVEVAASGSELLAAAGIVLRASTG